MLAAIVGFLRALPEGIALAHKIAGWIELLIAKIDEWKAKRAYDAAMKQAKKTGDTSELEKLFRGD